MKAASARAKTMLDGFTTGQKAIVALAVVGLVMAAFFLSRWVATPQLAPLFGNLSGTDASAIVEQLQASGVKYELTDGGHTVMVPQGQVYDLRVQMSGKGLPASGGESGSSYDLLDKGGLTATQFQQDVAYKRALEGELDKTLQHFDGVKTAVVHLAMPKKDVFASEQDKTTASVLLQLGPGAQLGRDQIRSVTSLVAGAVPGLTTDNVTVSDSTGRLLSSKDSGVGGSADAAGENLAKTAAYENDRAEKVQAMLDRVLGPGHASVDVSAVLNFDDIASVKELYSPVPSGTPTAESASGEAYGAAPGGIGGVLGQTWPTVSPQPSATSSGGYQKWNNARSNPINKEVIRSQGAPGKVERLTASVILDSTLKPAPDAAAIQAQVENALGIDTNRGDAVKVGLMAFDTTTAAATAKELKAAQKQEQLQTYIGMGKKAGLILLALLVLLIMSRRGKKNAKAKVSAQVDDLPAAAYANVLMGGVGPAAITASIEPLPTADDLAAERERIRERVANLVDNQPDDVAAVIQGWLSERSVG